MNNTTSFEAFCGGRFWDSEFTWGGDKPLFTDCFQQSVLVWGPCGFLWLLLVFYIPYLCSNAPINRRIPTSCLNVSKTVTGLGLCCVALVELVQGALVFRDDAAARIYFVSPMVLLITQLAAVVVFRAELRHGFVTSGVLWLFYFALVVCGIIPFYMNIVNTQELGFVEDMFRFVTFYVYYALLLAQFLLFCFAERSADDIYFDQDGKVACPEISASFLSRITFWWINGLVMTGYRKTLQEEDLWAPNPRDLTHNNAPAFMSTWNKQAAKYYASPTDALPKAPRRGKERRAGEKTPLLADTDLLDESYMALKTGPTAIKKKKGTPSLAWAIAIEFGPMLLVSHACKVVVDVLTFVGPIIQGWLIAYTEDPFVQQWKGYWYAVLFFITSVVQSFFFHQLFHIGMTLGMRVKASLIATIYQKALTMSPESRKTTTVGEIVNLMSVDAQRLQDLFGYLWLFWSAPLQIALAVWLLWQQLGPSVLAGLGLMILLGPINGVIGTIQRKLQMAQMRQKDERIKLMNEVLNGIKVIKLYAWELSFKDKINRIRETELDTLQKYAYLSAVSTFLWTCAPFLVTLVCFLTYTLTGGVLDANKAFVSLSLLNILRFPIQLLPMLITYTVTAMVSLQRITTFLLTGDIDLDNVQHDPTAEHPLTIRDGSFSWGTTADDLPILKRVTVEIREGELVAVVGTVGAGKSSMLSAILGEMVKNSGAVNVRGSIAYVAQKAWIQNATLRDNILFGSALEERRYDDILDACALKPDLEILPAGDQTEIGEKGINLSGGQKQRVSLARAVYSDADIYLLDDPLSAVDAHVGKHIFEKVVSNSTGLLRRKTRVLVTHGVQWLPRVDKIIVLSHGEVSEAGTYEELLSHDGAFARFLKTYLTSEQAGEGESGESSEEDEEVKAEKRRILERLVSITSDPKSDPKVKDGSGGADNASGKGFGAGSTVRRRKKTKSMMSDGKSGGGGKLSRQKSKREDELKPAEKKAGTKLIETERSEEGGVKWSVFRSYIRALGRFFSVLWFVFFILYQVASVLSNIWLSVWTEDPLIGNATLANTSEYAQARNMYLGIYGGLGGTQAVFVLLYAMVTAVSMVHASRLLHENMLYNILRSPMIFFDTTPIGRILNRFSRDIETIDNLLPTLIRSWINTFFGVIATVVVISYSTPLFLTVVLPLAVLYYFIQRFYIPTSRQLKRIESTTRSPIYVHFSETVTGASTIRAYRAQQRFCGHSEHLVNHNLAYYFSGIASNRWLGFRLEFMGALIVFSAAMFAVIGKSSLTGGLVGLSISYALQVTQSLNWMVRMTSDLETNIVSVERVKEYSETPQEAEWELASSRPPPGWPDEGRIALETYSTRYRPGLDLVLKGITAHIHAHEKIGIVGRTGAGKSSLTVALFRLIEAAGGSIQIDGIPINILGLHQLRTKLTILPQDPVLFSGTLRMNLDPLGRYTDDQLWNALEQAHLKQFVMDKCPAKLNHECGEGGQNLSDGQQQLVCLARTLLRKTRVLVLDEATASVDLETDELIQKTIRSEFSQCTILTIAHRLNTIMDSNRVMVLDNGQIAEFDTPDILLQRKSSIFYSMCRHAGLVGGATGNGGAGGNGAGSGAGSAGSGAESGAGSGAGKSAGSGTGKGAGSTSSGAGSAGSGAGSGGSGAGSAGSGAGSAGSGAGSAGSGGEEGNEADSLVVVDPDGRDAHEGGAH